MPRSAQFDLLDRLVRSDRAKKALSSPETRQRISERTREAMADPEVRKRVSERTKAAHDVPGMRERKLAGLKAAFADPSLRRKISEATKRGMAAKAERDFMELREAWLKSPVAVRKRLLREFYLIDEFQIRQLANLAARSTGKPPIGGLFLSPPGGE